MRVTYYSYYNITLLLTSLNNHTLVLAVATVTLVDSVISVNEYDNYTMVCANLTDGILDREIAIYFEALDDTALGK